ncbi:MAG: nucleotidyltransferase domain-containing protein [Pseudomonadota bacterium]|nr:nucleotidyltransferase domain-containing protein [Pseudomonadota bacterium]
MNPAHQRIVDEVTTALPGVEAVYLFGSADTPEQRADSDIDLAFLSRQPVDAVRRWTFAQQLASRLGRDVDLVDLREASAVMRAQVVAHGRRLYCANESACERYEDYVFAAYARLNESRRDILEQIARAGRIHGG